jgi:predicted Zn finger-like uncharacterized protein
MTDPAAIDVACPHCDARYLVPVNLFGPGGARVLCPGCDQTFDVPAPAAIAGAIAQAIEPAAPPAPEPAYAAAPDPEPARAAAPDPEPAPAREPTRAPAPGPTRAPAPESMRANLAPPAAVPSSAPPVRGEPASRVAGEEAPIDVARSLIGALADREGAEIDRSVVEGRLFARFGPAIFAAYDEYRRRAREGGPAPFRAALQERWGVELPEITPRH